MQFETLLITQPLTLHIRTFDRKWPGTPKQAELRSLNPELHATAREPIPLPLTTPCLAMWEKIHRDYTPSRKPAYMACMPPSSPIPPPAICAAAASHSHLMTSTIFRWATGHSFDTEYSDHFRPRADDPTTCPCNTSCNDANPHDPSPPPQRHTKEHIIFHCTRYSTQRLAYL
jgi:hypothetical protein